MTTPRMQFSFPVVAQIRKGAPKQPGKNRKGEDILVVGPDLKDRMRVAFLPGAEEYRALFIAGHPELAGQAPESLKTLTVHRVRAMIPFAKVWEGLETWSEAYQAGRMVLRANDKQVITRRDPSTGEYLVRDGEPFEAFVPGQPIVYERDGRRFELRTRTTTRLKLFLPDLGRMVMFELKSTSFYDSVNLKQNLGAIQLLADMLNGGVAGGIPFFVYRVEQQVTWNKPGGQAQRVPHWIYQIEVDPDWVKAATQRMTGYALTGQQIAGLLAPVADLSGTEDPATGYNDPEEDAEGDVIDQEFIPDSEPAIDPPVVERPAPDAQPETKSQTAPESQAPQSPEEIVKAAPHNADNTLVRPMAPETLRAALTIKTAQPKYASRKATDKQLRLAAILIEQAIAGMENPEKIRHSVTAYLIGCESLKDATGPQLAVLLDWLNPAQSDDGSGEYLVDGLSAKEITSVWTAACEAAGQLNLF